MKKLMIGLITLVSINSYAINLENALELNDPSLVKKALSIVLEDSEIKCDFVEGTGKQTSKEDIEKFINFNDSIIQINEELDQPVITVSQNREDGIYVEVNFTTSSNFKDIVKLEILLARTSEKEVNTGTLVKPNIEVIKTTKTVFREECR